MQEGPQPPPCLTFRIFGKLKIEFFSQINETQKTRVVFRITTKEKTRSRQIYVDGGPCQPLNGKQNFDLRSFGEEKIIFQLAIN